MTKQTAEAEVRQEAARLHARLKARSNRPPLLSLLLAKVRFLKNKMDELRTSITTQQKIWDCSALIFTETLLSETTPDSMVSKRTLCTARTKQQCLARIKVAVSAFTSTTGGAQMSRSSASTAQQMQNYSIAFVSGNADDYKKAR